MDKRQTVIHYLYNLIMNSYSKRGYKLDSYGYVWIHVSSKSEDFNRALYELERADGFQLELHPTSINVGVPIGALTGEGIRLKKETIDKWQSLDMCTARFGMINE